MSSELGWTSMGTDNKMDSCISKSGITQSSSYSMNQIFTDTQFR
jgi:hypothetical protein